MSHGGVEKSEAMMPEFWVLVLALPSVSCELAFLGLSLLPP